MSEVRHGPRARNGGQLGRRADTSPDCFLCAPEPEFTWARSRKFQAVLGLGPVCEGYTVLSARDHVPSMLDLDEEDVAALLSFGDYVRRRLETAYGPSTMTEHGRVAPCAVRRANVHDPHCLHAHRLVFPNLRDFDLRDLAPGLNVEAFPSFREAHREFAWPGQYLLVESADRGVQIASVEGRLPRQFLRALAARQLGRPELANWRVDPGFRTIAAARRALGLSS